MKTFPEKYTKKEIIDERILRKYLKEFLTIQI